MKLKFAAAGLSVALLVGATVLRGPLVAADPPGVIGGRLEEAGKWLEAAQLYRRLALSGATIDPGWVQRAIVAYLTADRAADAEAFTADVLQRDPDFLEVLFFYGEGQRVTMRYEEAEGTYRRLLERRPRHVKGSLSLGHVLSRLGRAEEALPFFEAFLDNPAQEEFLRDQAELDYARALRTLGRTQDALDRLTMLLERKPYHPQALTEVARVLVRLKKRELAKALRGTVSYLAKRGHLQTTDDGRSLVSEGPVNVRVKARVALHAEDRYEFLPALEGYRQVVRETVGEPEPVELLASLLFRIKRFSECVRVIDELGAATVDLYLLRFLAQVSEGRDDEAMASLERLFHERSSLRNTPAAHKILLAAVHNQLDTGRGLDVAARWLRVAVEVAPDEPAVLLARVRLLLARGRVDHAARRLERYPEAARAGSAAYLRLQAVAKGLSGDKEFAGSQLLALMRAAPGERRNFIAFARVFAADSSPSARQVLQLGGRLAGRLERLTQAYRALSQGPLDKCATLYRQTARLLLDAGNRRSAIDCLFMASALDDGVDAPLALGQLLIRPPELFPRLNALRTALARAPDDRRVKATLVRVYAEQGLRMGEASRLAEELARDHPGAESAELRALVRVKQEALRDER